MTDNKRGDRAATEGPKLPLRWQKAQVIAVVMASIAVPVVLAVIGNAYTNAQKAAERAHLRERQEAELSVRYVELAVEILRTPPRKQGNQMRGWAIQVLDRFSPVSLPAPAKESLATTQLQVATDATALDDLADKTDQEVLQELRKLRERRSGAPSGESP
jgi:uncharacterized protein (DUF1684 family)